MNILDCTLRDGGYYTNWDFARPLADMYFEAMNELPVDWVEVGYRSPPMGSYHGEYYYCPPSRLKEIRRACTKKLAVILNEKDVPAEQAGALLGPCAGLLDMVRLAVDPKHFKRALKLAEAIKKLGFQVSFNVMYMSAWDKQPDLLDAFGGMDGLVDCLYMVDSYGGVYPDDVVRTIEMVRPKTGVALGFHGHNNLELGLANTVTALRHGVEMVDATITGMGRGAGNLKTELLLTFLQSKGEIELEFNPLSDVVDAFGKLQAQYGWGTNLPYMVSGANSLPQKQVMEWVGMRYYSFNSILLALSNQAKGMEDNRHLPRLDFAAESPRRAALIVGGGPSAVEHAPAIEEFLRKNPDMVVVHASSKNAMSYRKIPNDQIFCLVGNEGHRLEDVFGPDTPVKGKCILPSYPRKMGTYVPRALESCAYELQQVTFTDRYQDSHTALALQTVFELGLTHAYVAGYDSYSAANYGERQRDLIKENEHLFGAAIAKGMKLRSLTPTQYANLEKLSIYSLIA
jgi:4-hydroxy 2-oxovalerate aldolase